jgi:hypothetical protein
MSPENPDEVLRAGAYPPTPCRPKERLALLRTDRDAALDGVFEALADVGIKRDLPRQQVSHSKSKSTPRLAPNSSVTVCNRDTRAAR